MGWRVGVLKVHGLGRFKKLCSHSGPGVLIFGEALAKEHVRSDLRLSRNKAKNQKHRLSLPPDRMATVFFNPL